MKRYYKYKHKELGELHYSYYELDHELYCLRAVYETDNALINTNLTIEDSKYFLPEESFEESLHEITAISYVEFLKKWKKSIFSHIKNWLKLTNELQPEDTITAKIVCFYPQGIILDINKPFYAIANYDKCRTHFGYNKMQPNQLLDMKVVSFDDENMWVKLGV